MVLWLWLVLLGPSFLKRKLLKLSNQFKVGLVFTNPFFIVPPAGIEPALAVSANRILSPACLPIPPQGQEWAFPHGQKNLKLTYAQWGILRGRSQSLFSVHHSKLSCVSKSLGKQKMGAWTSAFIIGVTWENPSHTSEK